MKIHRLVSAWALVLPLAAATIWEAAGVKYPARGFVSSGKARSWEHSLIVGNGKTGALIPGEPLNEGIILSHENLFLPVTPVKPHPPMPAHLDEIRRLTMERKGREASELMVRVGRENGFPDIVNTNPLVPAAVLDLEMQGAPQPVNYARSVDFETGEALVAWGDGSTTVHRQMFVSRPDDVAVLSMRALNGSGVSCRLRLRQLTPRPADQRLVEQTIKRATASAEGGTLTFEVEFNTPWPGGLGGYGVASKVIARGGSLSAAGAWINVKDARELLVLSRVELMKPFDASALGRLRASLNNVEPDYAMLLRRHAKVHGELFRRSALRLDTAGQAPATVEELIAGSDVGKTSQALLEKLYDAARYNIICSTGTLPPTLQGIWGGTWRPAWSSDFTQDGNVQVAISSSLSTGFPEVVRAYLDYMTRLQDDFRVNARKLYGARGIWVPSRSSDHGQVVHYNAGFPGLYWNAGAAWIAQYYYDYFLYAGDRAFLEKQALPWMLDAAAFYEDFLTVEREGRYVFTPSYSPEIGPLGVGTPVVPNATMDIAAVKQLLRNLIALNAATRLDPSRIERWKAMLGKLPAYEVDSKGSFREWLWPGMENNDQHRHASHLYPLYFGVDPEIAASPDLARAASQAIESRLQYRRGKNGGEMAFGLVQLGLSAAHLRDGKHAYETVEWLSNRYWTTALGSFHDPGSIFNVDISGGLPAVIAELLMQSTAANEIHLLPVLPKQWPDGSISGLRARGGFRVDLAWRNGKLTTARIHSDLGKPCQVIYNGKTANLKTKAGGNYDVAAVML